MTCRAAFKGVATLALAGALTACYTVSFDPLPRPAIPQTIPARVGVYVAPGITDATYSFRSFGSGAANRWTVPYGARLRESALSYLGAASQGATELKSPDAAFDGDLVVRIDRAEYAIRDQAARLKIDVGVRDRSGNEVLRKDYESKGWSGQGAVAGGGVFAQKAVTRSSTDDAMKDVMLALIEDLGRAPGSQ